MKHNLKLATIIVSAGLLSWPVAASAMTEAADVCIDALRATNLPDAKAGGEILSNSFSEAGTLVKYATPAEQYGDALLTKTGP